MQLSLPKAGVLLTCLVAAASGLHAFAATICVGQTCSVTIPTDPGAATSNFQTPGATATSGYTIVTSDNGTNFTVTLTDVNANALEFSNLYFDTIASTPGTGSNLGFEFGVNTEDAFDPNSGTKYNLTGTGVTEMFTQDAINGTVARIVIPNSFFLTDPLGMPFMPTPPGTLVSLHLSQSFGYSVVGGSANFPAPVELGEAIVGSGSTAVTPEPSSFLLMGTGMLFIGGLAHRRLFA